MGKITMQDILNGINFNSILYQRWDQKLKKYYSLRREIFFLGKCTHLSSMFPEPKDQPEDT